MSRFLSPRLERLEPYVPGEQPQNMEEFIKLNTNENPYPPSPAVLDALTREEAARLRLYPDTQANEVRRAAADLYGIDPEGVVCGNGSDEVLSLAFQAFCLGASARFADITYGFYKVWADLYGVKKHIVPLKEDFSLDPADYYDAGETCFIANPNAPTGLALPRAALEQVLRRNPASVVVVDEAYVDFGAESCVPLTKTCDNLLVVQTLSKSRCLAGARLGLGIASPALAADLQRGRGSFHPYNLNRLSILAGPAALRDRPYFEKCTARVVATREKTRAALLALGCTVPQSRANFLFVRVPGIPGGEFCRRLRKLGILVRWFDAPRIDGYVRVTVGTEEQMEHFTAVTTAMVKEAAL